MMTTHYSQIRLFAVTIQAPRITDELLLQLITGDATLELRANIATEVVDGLTLIVDCPPVPERVQLIVWPTAGLNAVNPAVIQTISVTPQAGTLQAVALVRNRVQADEGFGLTPPQWEYIRSEEVA